jgi:hypothetical protein
MPKIKLAVSCYFLTDFFFDLEDGGDMFLQTIG